MQFTMHIELKLHNRMHWNKQDHRLSKYKNVIVKEQ